MHAGYSLGEREFYLERKGTLSLYCIGLVWPLLTLTNRCVFSLNFVEMPHQSQTQTEVLFRTNLMQAIALCNQITLLVLSSYSFNPFFKDLKYLTFRVEVM